MHEQVESTIGKDPGALDLFEAELERLEKSLAALAARVGPVSNQYGADNVVATSEPRSEPPTQLHGKVERLRDLIRDLDGIQSRIEL